MSAFSPDKIASIVLTLALAISPFLIIIFLHYKKPKLKQKKFQNMFNSLYANLAVERDYTLLNIALFLIRRFVMALNIVFLTDYESLQIIIQILTSVLLLIYFI